MTNTANPTIITNPTTGQVVDLDAFAERWAAGTMTAADDALWAELVKVPAIRVYVMKAVGY